MAVKLLTYTERKEIEALLHKGATFPQIGKILGRSKNTVRNEVRKFGARENYSAKKAQALCDSAPERTRKSLKAFLAKENKPTTPATLKKRQESCISPHSSSYVV